MAIAHSLTQSRNSAAVGCDSHSLGASAPLRKISRLRLAIAVLVLSSSGGARQLRGQSLADRLSDAPSHAEPADESAQFVIKNVQTGLDNPVGLAIRGGAADGGPFELFFSESGGGRVMRLSTDKPDELQPVVTGFPTRMFRRGNEYRVGPLGLAFLSRMKLAVGLGGGTADVPIAVYNLPEAGQSVAHDAAVADASLPASNNSPTSAVFFSLTRTEGSLLIAACDDEGVGGVYKASIDANELSSLRQLAKAPSAASARGVLGVTINPKPRANYLLSVQMGDVGEQRDSRITFYAPGSGDVALQLQAGVRDAAAVSYSPTGDLYLADAAWDDPASGAVYRIDAAEVDGRQSCRPVKIAAVERPTSLAFTADGSLYVTAFGDRNNPDAPSTGALLKITPKEGAPPL